MTDEARPVPSEPGFVLLHRTIDRFGIGRADNLALRIEELGCQRDSARQQLQELAKRTREQKPCVICRWPRPMDNEHNICECCGFQEGYDDPEHYKWKGEWWAGRIESQPEIERKPDILVKLESDLVEAHQQLDALIAALRTQLDSRRATAQGSSPRLGRARWIPGFQLSQTRTSVGGFAIVFMRRCLRSTGYVMCSLVTAGRSSGMSESEGWEVDAWRNSITEGIVLGWPSFPYVGKWSSYDPVWKKRRQRLRVCQQCACVLLDGPDTWTYCQHTQPLASAHGGKEP